MATTASYIIYALLTQQHIDIGHNYSVDTHSVCNILAYVRIYNSMCWLNAAANSYFNNIYKCILKIPRNPLMTAVSGDFEFV